MEESPSIRHVQECLDRLREGDTTARNELIALATRRLERLARKMLRDGFPHLRRWLDTDDVFQNSVARLCGTLSEVIPDSPLHFHRLAALQVRRELIDLARHYFGPQGHAANYASVARPSGDEPSPDPPDAGRSPSQLLEWRELHELVQTLPDDEAAVVDLLLYQGLTQEQAKDLLGVDVRTIQRRWQRARVALYKSLRSGESTA